MELADLAKRKDLAGGQERNHLHRATSNGAWLSAIPYHLNITELSLEELQDNLRLRHGLMPQDIPETCDGCGKKFSIEHALSCPKDGLVLVRHNDAAKAWCAFRSGALVPSDITSEPKINSRTVQGESTKVGSWQESGIADSGAEIVEEAQGGIRLTVNRADRLEDRLGQVQVPAESRADVSAHGLWKRRTTAMFDIRIVNLDAGSYLRMTP